MSEYGRRAAPVAGKVLSSEALERWRARARDHLNTVAANDDNIGNKAAAPADVAGESTMDQRRRASRQKTLIGGKVVFNDMMSLFDCSIRDLSDTGARIKLNAPVQVPQVFMLRFNDGRVRNCKVRRRNALELGIEFLD